MPIKTWRMTAVAVAFAVWLAYSVPVHAVVTVTSSNNIPARTVVQGDDDDDGLSGGALAVLLLAVGGAVAAVWYASLHNNDSVDLNLVEGKTATVSMESTGAGGKQKRSWTATMDKTAGTITLTKGGTSWTGKADGKYYPVTGDPRASEYSFTKVDSRTLTFTARKAGRVTRTGRIVLSANGRSITINKDRMSSSGRRLNKQITYSAH